jgi:hypothetical protein
VEKEMNFVINKDLDNFIVNNDIRFAEFKKCIDAISDDTYYVGAVTPYEETAFEVVENFCEKFSNTNFQLCYVYVNSDDGNIVIMNEKTDCEELKRRLKMKAFW